MTDHRIDIALADSSRIRYRVIYLGDHIGTWSDPESAAARYMLIRGIAGKEDTLIAYRNGKASLTGGVGWLASQGPVGRRFRQAAKGSVAAKSGSGGTTLPETPEEPP